MLNSQFSITIRNIVPVVPLDTGASAFPSDEN